jgi:hypothetical protein
MIGLDIEVTSLLWRLISTLHGEGHLLSIEM